MVPPTKTKPLASTARCMMGVRMLRVMLMMSSLLERGRVEAVDAETADAGLGAAIDDQLRHDGAGTGAKLETVQGKAELMIEALVARTRPEHGNIVLHLGFDAGPGAHDGRIAHHRKQLEHGAGA